MSFNNKMTNNQGFTIVELLIVVIVIAILATITIVSFNNITGRANQSASDSAVATFVKKAELYAADGDTGAYPATFAVLNDSSKSFHMTSGAVYVASAAAATTALTDEVGKNTVAVQRCPATGTVTGLMIYARRYVASTSPAQAAGSVNNVRTLGASC